MIALHRLYETKPSIDTTVKELVGGIPDTLSFKNEKDQLRAPIQSSLWNPDTFKYVPILQRKASNTKPVAEEHAVDYWW